MKVMRQRKRHTKEADSMPRSRGKQSICRQDSSPRCKTQHKKGEGKHTAATKNIQKDHNGLRHHDNGRKAQEGRSRQQHTLKALMAFCRLSASPAEVAPWFHSRLRGRGICPDCLLFTGGSPADLPLLVVSVPPAPYATTAAWQRGTSARCVNHGSWMRAAVYHDA